MTERKANSDLALDMNEGCIYFLFLGGLVLTFSSTVFPSSLSDFDPSLLSTVPMFKQSYELNLAKN